jgi:hypothetical protein
MEDLWSREEGGGKWWTESTTKLAMTTLADEFARL